MRDFKDPPHVCADKKYQVATFLYHNTLHLCVQRWLGYDPTQYNTEEPIPAAVARYEVFVRKCRWKYQKSRGVACLSFLYHPLSS